MAFIDTVPVSEAKGAVRDLYQRYQDHAGYVPNYTKVFSRRPAVLDAWATLLASIRKNMTVRDYELTTLAAARALRSSYCMLAHGSVLADKVFDEATVAEIARGRSEALEAKEAALMTFADKVARNAHEVSREDVARLREHGYHDEAIFDIAAAAAARCFFSKLLDAVGAEPDASYKGKSADFVEALVVGRPVSEEPDERLDSSP